MPLKSAVSSREEVQAIPLYLLLIYRQRDKIKA